MLLPENFIVYQIPRKYLAEEQNDKDKQLNCKCSSKLFPQKLSVESTPFVVGVNVKTVKVSEELHKALLMRGKKGESFNTIIENLLKEVMK